MKVQNQVFKPTKKFIMLPKRYVKETLTLLIINI